MWRGLGGPNLYLRLKYIVVTIITMSISMLCTPIYALKIESPKEGEYVYAGSKMTVIVKPEAGENWKAVSFGFDGMNYDPAKNEYSITVDVPLDYLGYYDNLIVTAADEEGNSIQLRRSIIVKMPPDVVLEAISIYPEYILLVKLLPDDPQNEKEQYERREISVDGKYSDNVERDLSGSSRGTVYSSSNTKIATVSPEGIVTAQSPGTARIIVQNGKHRAEVTAEVLPVKRYPDGKIKLY